MQDASLEENRKPAGIRRFLPVVLSFAAVVVVNYLGGLEPIESRLTDLRFEIVTRDATDDLVVVAIDPPSLQELNVWPWPRSYHAALLDNLLAAGAKRVAFDIEFSSASTPQADDRFAQSLEAAAGKVILPIFRQIHQGSGGAKYINNEPIDILRQHVELATINVQPEWNSLVRRMPTRDYWGGKDVPALSTLLAEQPDFPYPSFYIDFGILPQSVPSLSYADVLAGRFDPNAVEGKLVVIGTTALELQDYFPVPNYFTLSGVVLHALAYQSITHDRALQRTGAIPILIVSLLIALVLGPRFVTWSWKRGLLVITGASLGLLLLATGAQAAWPILVDVVPAIAVLVCVYLAELIRKIDRQAFNLFVQSMTLKRTDSLMRKIVEQSFNGVLTIGENGGIETANAAANSLFGYRDNGIIGVNIAKLIPATATSDHPDGDILSEGQHDATARRSDGSKFFVNISISELEHDDHRQFVAIVRDISDQKRHEEELRHQALHDSLTDLPNRALLMNRIEHALNVALREEKPLALLLIDLDRFKEINDTFGHHVGDMLLKDVAERLSAPLRKTDTIARLGGDEFSVLLPAVSNTEMALEVAERAIVQLQEPFNVEGMFLEVGASIGVAVFPDHAKTPAELLKCSDIAMYGAKASQKNVVLYDQEQDKNSVRNLALTGELRRAITEDHLNLFVQPKIDIAGNRVCAAEALLR